MLLDEEKAAALTNPVHMSYELDTKNFNQRVSPSLAERSYGYGNSSMLVEPKRTEPLITKAYDAFRKHKSVNKVENLVPTEAYIDEQFRKSIDERTISGLKSREKKVSTSHVQTINDDALGDSNSLPLLAPV